MQVWSWRERDVQWMRFCRLVRLLLPHRMGWTSTFFLPPHYFWVVQLQTCWFLFYFFFFFSFHRNANYTMVWNVLDYTALVLPTGLSVDPVLDAKEPAHIFYNDLDKKNYDFCMEIYFIFLQPLFRTHTMICRWSGDFQGCADMYSSCWKNPRRRGCHRHGRDCGFGFEKQGSFIQTLI